MSQRCETCVHWEPLAYSELDYSLDDTGAWRNDHREPDPALVEAVRLPWGNCQRVSEIEFTTETSPRFHVIDASDYKAHLNTRADFGCVEHQVKT